MEELFGCDDATLCVRTGGRLKAMYLVYGNSPGELVCDYHVCDVLDRVTEAHYAKWSELPQPTKEVA